MFILIFRLSKGQVGEAWEPSNIHFSYGTEITFTRSRESNFCLVEVIIVSQITVDFQTMGRTLGQTWSQSTNNGKGPSSPTAMDPLRDPPLLIEILPELFHRWKGDQSGASISPIHLARECYRSINGTTLIGVRDVEVRTPLTITV